MSIHKIVEPVMFNKDLGQPLDLNSINFTQKNADGKPVIPMTTEQKYVFDASELKWLLAQIKWFFDVPAMEFPTAVHLREAIYVCRYCIVRFGPGTLIPQSGSP